MSPFHREMAGHDARLDRLRATLDEAADALSAVANTHEACGPTCDRIRRLLSDGDRRGNIVLLREAALDAEAALIGPSDMDASCAMALSALRDARPQPAGTGTTA